MAAQRWDETWHRLNMWTSGQAPSERLAAQLMLQEGFASLDPSHPLGGPDGGKDAIMRKGDAKWIMAVYFPRGQQSFNSIKEKFLKDLAGVAKNNASAMAFVCNQELTLKERQSLIELGEGACDIYHLERIVAILDSPTMARTREQFLRIQESREVARPVFVHRLADGNVPRLFGRTDELAMLSTFLLSDFGGDTPDASVIMGMPGVGKTSLAVNAAVKATATGRFPGGSLLVDFGGYEEHSTDRVDVSHALPSLILALGGEETTLEAGDNTIKYHAQLEHLERHGRSTILVFDNVSEVSQVSSLLPSVVSRHRVLITSRNTIAPLLHGRASMISVSPIDERDAISLIAHFSGRSSGLDNEPLEDLSKICGRLPIALQIVSHILLSDPVTGIRDLVDELASETERLSGLEFEDVEVRAAFRGSYLRLPTETRQALRKLSLHPGQRLSLTSCSRLLAATEVAARRALRHLENAHLVTRDQTSSMWAFHDLLRLYASELGRAEDRETDRVEAQQRLIDHYSAAMTEFGVWYAGGESVDSDAAEPFDDAQAALSWADKEYDSAVACVSLGHEMGHREAAWEIAVNLNRYLILRRQVATAIAVSELAVTISRELNDEGKEIDSLNNLALDYNYAYRYEEARPIFLEMKRRCRELGDKGGEARALVGLAEAMRGEGNKEASVQVLRRAVRLCYEVKDRGGVGYALTNLATSLREAGQTKEAIEPLRMALKVHRENGATQAEAATLGQLGTALGDLGDHQEALRVIDATVTLAESIGDLLLVAMVTMNAGSIHRILGDRKAAEAKYISAIDTFAEIEDVVHQAAGLKNLIALYRDTGSSAKAQKVILRLRALEARFPSVSDIVAAKWRKLGR